MISRLIDLEISPKKQNNSINNDMKIQNNDFSIKDYAFAFISGMSENQLNRFKLMLDNNIQCGMSVARCYGIDYEDFITEVKNQLNF